jgi:hypothetical protein
MKFLRKKIVIIPAILFVAVVLAYPYRYEISEWLQTKLGITLPEDPRPPGVGDLEWCERNYKDEMLELSAKYGVPYEYLMALTVLECSGNKPAGHRFEKHIFRRLEKIKNGGSNRFEGIKTDHLKELDEDGLKNLATSWGPFQLMGYKAIHLDAVVNDLREEEAAAEIGVRWIKKEYGHFLEKGRFKDAFHYHNTGDRFPLSGRPKTILCVEWPQIHEILRLTQIKKPTIRRFFFIVFFYSIRTEDRLLPHR